MKATTKLDRSGLFGALQKSRNSLNDILSIVMGLQHVIEMFLHSGHQVNGGNAAVSRHISFRFKQQLRVYWMDIDCPWLMPQLRIHPLYHAMFFSLDTEHCPTAPGSVSEYLQCISSTTPQGPVVDFYSYGSGVRSRTTPSQGVPTQHSRNPSGSRET